MQDRTATMLLLAVCLLLPQAGFGQEFRATISGHVYDSSGGAVPSARVQAVNVANNETANAVTDTSGTYTIPFLRPGQYRLSVTASGFKSYNRENVILEVGKLVGIDITLEVGQVTESINVTAEAALLETQTASRVGVINQQQVTELPLNSRNPFMLGAMMSGVTFRGAAIWQRPFDNGAIAEWSVNGGRQSNNEFLMDGAPNNGQAGGNNIAYVPIVDAVQEFSVQQNSYDAAYGKTGGGVFNVVLKSGTNDFHATGWEFMRRKWLDANTFQNNAVGAVRPAHTLDQYGFQLEGPVYIPKILKKDGPVKLFYLGSFENYREDWPQFLRNSFPEPEMRQGDFSKLRNAAGAPVTIYNPFATRTDPNGDPIRDPFPGNVIPQSMLNPVALNVTKYMPLPNASTPGVAYSTQNHLLPEYAAQDKFYNLILKFDWNFGDKHRAYFRHASNDRTEDRCINGICTGPGQDGQQPFQRINDAYVADWVGTITPTLVLNLRLSYNRFIEKGFGRANEGFDLTSLGLPGSLVNQLPGPTYFGRWEFPDSYSPLGRYQSINITNNYNLMFNVTKIAGSHTLKAGIDLRRIHYIRQNSGNILFFRTEKDFTQRIWNQADPTSADTYATFLLGLQHPRADNVPSQNYPVYPFNRQWYVAPYIQDDWKVSRRLSVNMGLRWDYNGAPDEKYNRLNRGFNANLPSPLGQQIPAEMLAMYPNLRNLSGGFEFVGVNGNSTRASTDRWLNFQPRIGAAYQLSDRLVMRGGWGLYYLNPNNDYLREVGFSTITPMVTTLDGGRTPIPNQLSNPYPNGINTPTGSSLGALTFVGRDSQWFNPRTFVTPTVKQFSFGFQFQVSSTATVELSYVGSRSNNLNTERNYNIPSAEFRRRCNLQEGGSPLYCNEQLPNPFRGVTAFAGTPFFTANTLSRYQLNRPFPQFNGNLLEQGRNDSKIWYNSLQVNYNQRMGRNLTLLFNYTFSKMVERWGFNDAFNYVSQQGLYFNDVPHFLKFSTVYELPFGRGQKFGSGAGGFVNRLISGWTVSTYTNWKSGEPNNLPGNMTGALGNVIMLKDPRTVAGDWKGSVNWTDHQVVGWNPCVLRQFNDGSIVPQGYSLSRGCGTDPNNYAWLMTAEYAPRYTPSRSGQIRKQQLFNIDISFSKMTQITERLRFQFGVEAFNLTNYYYFGRDSNFNTDPNSPNFGTLFPSQAWIGNGYPRQVQLRLKLLW